MKSLKKTAYCYWASLSIFGMALSLMPIEIEAQCSDSDLCYSFTEVPDLAKRKPRPPQGTEVTREPITEVTREPITDNPFVSDIAQNLLFSFNLESIAFAGINGHSVAGPIIPYVVSPAGKVYTGATFAFAPTNALQGITVTVDSPVYGNYVFGLQVPGHDDLVTITYNLQVNTSDGRSTTMYPPPSMTRIFFSETLNPASNDAAVQLSANYSYGPIGTVPQP